MAKCRYQILSHFSLWEPNPALFSELREHVDCGCACNPATAMTGKGMCLLSCEEEVGVLGVAPTSCTSPWLARRRWVLEGATVSTPFSLIAFLLLPARGALLPSALGTTLPCSCHWSCVQAVGVSSPLPSSSWFQGFWG